jgi:NAD+ synthase (glutamine-hydrolysing)
MKKSNKSLRIAVAQINTTLGNFAANREKIVAYIRRAQEKHCDLVVFPESTLFGYHPFDLLERKKLVDQQLQELKRIEKAIPEGMAALVGVLTKNPDKKGRPYFNSTALLQKGKKTRFFHKELLPTGDVFDEARFIENGDMSENFFTFKGHRILVTICEDIWAWPDAGGHSQYSHNPLLQFKGQKVDLIVNQSASPFFDGKLKIRKKLVQQTAQLLKAPMVYVNLVGAQDEIIFDGASFALDAKGKTLLQSVAFEEDINVLDLGKMEGGVRPLIQSTHETLRQALVLGIKDFCEKSGLSKIHLGLSGGVDSALVACLAVDALGPSNVTGLALPSQYNSPDSLKLAEKLAKNLGIRFLEVPIQNVYESAKKTIDQAYGIESFGLVHENLQARIRGMLLMAYSNKENSLLLVTSNKSELAAGYSTLYGDVCGGLAPIGDLTKTQVYGLCAIYNAERELIPEMILTRAPSAELRPNQKDQDSLPAYEDLDQSVDRLIRDCGSIKTKTDEWLSKAILRSEFKRWQSAPILKISKHSFGRGRRYPIAQKAMEI